MQLLALKTMQGLRQECIELQLYFSNSVFYFLGLVNKKIDFKALSYLYNKFTDSLKYVLLFVITASFL